MNIFLEHKTFLQFYFAKDIRLFYWIADCVTYSRPKWRRLRLRESVQLFEKMVKTEMDLRFEAAAASELLENFETIFQSILKEKPSKLKGEFILSAFLTSTMGISYKLKLGK